MHPRGPHGLLQIHPKRIINPRRPTPQQNAAEILRQEIGSVFATVLEHAGVYKCTPEGRTAFCKFIRSVS